MKRYSTSGIGSMVMRVFVSLLFFSGTVLKTAESRESDSFYIVKNIELLGEVYRDVSENYVDSIDTAEFMYAGIDGMLETLDPYTVFLDEKESDELGELTSGHYAGIGVRISEIAGAVYVLSVFDGSPAAKAGLRVGDRIEKVDRHIVKGKDLDEVKTFIKGPAGSEVVLTVERYGKKSRVRARITRREVRVNSIRYSGLLGEIGYLVMDSFGNRSPDELKRAINELDAASRITKRPMAGVILDLRNNPGGLLEAAVDVSGLFVSKGSQVVSTMGRDPESRISYKTKHAPVVEKRPLAILINKNSASAAEIVAGAIQELDRGVIVGNRSFGKGLVQSVITLPYDSKLKMTTSKYYTPSGRLIQQEHDWTGGPRKVLEREEKPADGMVFYTRNKRKVYGGGGILPDIRLDGDIPGSYEAALRKDGMLFRFANTYRASHDRIPQAGIDRKSLMRDFAGFLERESFIYKSEPEELLEEVRKSLAGNHKEAHPGIDSLVASLEKELKLLAGKQKSSESKQVALALEQEILRHYDEEAALRSRIEDDPVVKKALEVLQDPGRYSTLLSP
ncbi:MAG: S41 family peptidase [Prosthecochloris sp.]|nr:S41 family peptidase [Prosthecochloris sp.]